MHLESLQAIEKELGEQKDLRGDTKHDVEELAQKLRCAGVKFKDILQEIEATEETELGAHGIMICAEKDFER